MQTEDKKYLEQSKKILLENVTKKIKTTMIGAINAIETIFVEELATDLEFKRKFDQLRSNILSKGNTQIRALEEEFEFYTIHWDRHQLFMPVKPYPGE